jgi:hypothetical protein
MRDDDDLCWLCDDPLESDRAITSWHGFGAHRDCVRQQDSRADAQAASADSGASPDNDRVIRTST